MAKRAVTRSTTVVIIKFNLLIDKSTSTVNVDKTIKIMMQKQQQQKTAHLNPDPYRS